MATTTALTVEDLRQLRVLLEEQNGNQTPMEMTGQMASLTLDDDRDGTHATDAVASHEKNELPSMNIIMAQAVDLEELGIVPGDKKETDPTTMNEQLNELGVLERHDEEISIMASDDLANPRQRK